MPYYAIKFEVNNPKSKTLKFFAITIKKHAATLKELNDWFENEFSPKCPFPITDIINIEEQ